MKKYTFKKGKFYRTCLSFWPYFKRSSVILEAKFDESCLYHFEAPDTLDINKLYGLSQGIHHKNSARFGWRCVDNKSIEIVTYCYVDGVRLPEVILGSVAPNETCRLTLKVTPTKYYFKMESFSGTNIVNVDKIHTTTFGYTLYPYFGGNNPAPHKMSLYISIE